MAHVTGSGAAQVQRIEGDKRDYPVVLIKRQGEDAPAALEAIGPPSLLSARKTALFCSARMPGDAILRVHITPGGQTERIAERLNGWWVPVL